MRLGSLVLSALALAACEPLSAIGEGRNDAVRYQLPPHATEILEHATQLELLALGDQVEGATGADFFDGRRILGRAPVDPRGRREVARALYRAIDDARGEMLCFDPHHAIRARRGEERLELSICYGCWLLHLVTGEDRFVEIDPSALREALDPIIEDGTGLRFVQGPEDHFGRWRSREELDAPSEP